MPTRPLEALVRHVRRIAGASDPDPIGDADLVGRFNASRDQAAFAEIVQRHGPLVWAICRSSLNAADADDAFQATFLVLARKAKSIRKPASLACWLSGVARRTVHSVRGKSDHRREVALDADIVAHPSADAESDEQRAVLADELERLPDKYRLPTLLCYYQGLTNEEAARRLGWPHGTVCGRLARARELLRTRLARRGIGLTIGTLSVIPAGQPTELIAATLRTCAAAGTSWTPSIATLAEVTMHAMWLSKIKVAAVTALVVAVLGTGTGWVLAPVIAQDGNKPLPGVGKPATERFSQPLVPIEPPPGLPDTVDQKLADDLLAKAIEAVIKPSPLSDAKGDDDAVQKLLKERHKTAMRELQLRLQVFQAGARGGTISILIESVQRVYESESALCKTPDQRLAAAMRQYTIAKAIKAVNKLRFDVGQVAQQDLEHSGYFLISTQIKVATAANPRSTSNINMVGD
jgi:RNA polymerase sigma factor (sigma-70 family)